MESETMKLLLYVEALKHGEEIEKDLLEGELEIDTLSDYERMSLHSFQFSDYWGNQKMRNISFMVSQFPWLASSGSGV